MIIKFMAIPAPVTKISFQLHRFKWIKKEYMNHHPL